MADSCCCGDDIFRPLIGQIVWKERGEGEPALLHNLYAILPSPCVPALHSSLLFLVSPVFIVIWVNSVFIGRIFLSVIT